MAKFTVNGVELEYDVFELENAEKYQAEMQKITDMADKIQGETDIAKTIKIQCNAVFAFVDALFGEGKHKEIFGESVNLKTCVSVFSEIVENISDTGELDTILPKSNRAQRRAKM